MHETLAQLEEVKARWMAGGNAVSACPSGWQEALGERSELDLLALTGQFLRVATRPQPAGTIALRALLPAPTLTLPTPQVWALIRRALQANPNHATAIVTLIAARGFAVTPMDWMPRPGAQDVPAGYVPWLDWLAEADHDHDADAVPTAETWDDLPPHARLAAVEVLRRTDPAAARDLIVAVAPSLPADARCRLLSILTIGLDESDAECLAPFADDRSSKVKILTHQLLTRLGKIEPDPDVMAEFAGFFERKRKGPLSSQKVVKARKLKSKPQAAQRAQIAMVVPVHAFAQAMGLSVLDLINEWSFGDASDEFIAMVADTGSPEHAERLLLRLMDEPSWLGHAPALLDRLSADARLALAPRLAEVDPQTLGLTLHCLGEQLGRLDEPALRKSPTLAELCQSLNDSKQKDTPRADAAVDTALRNLGLVASPTAAEVILNELLSLGLLAADPRLAVLRLNAALKDTRS